jgi:hypothetical protein
VFSKMLSKLTSLKPTDQRQIQFVKVSKRFGFDKLLPIICAFFLIFLLDVARNIVVMGGQAIPPVISYSPTTLIINDSSDSMIQCLWKTHSESLHLQQEATLKAAASPQETERLSRKDPDPSHLDTRYGLVNFEDISEMINEAVADAEVQHKEADPVNGLHYAQDETGTPHMVFSALKFLFIYTLMVSFLELRHSTTRPRVVFRTIVLFGVLLVGMFGYLLRCLKTEEHVEDMKRYVAQTYPLKDSMNCEAFDDKTDIDLETLYEKAVSREQSRRNRWWSLQFPDTTIFIWSWEQLRGPRPVQQLDRHQAP